MDTMTATKFEIKGWKVAGGEETPRFEASIYKDGSKVGIVYNEGCGGCNFYRFTNPADSDAFDNFCHEWGVATNEPLTEITDAWVYTEMDKWENRKMLLRVSKKKTPFRVKGDEDGVWRTWNRPLPESRQSIIAKYGDTIETIFDPAVQS